MYFKTIVKLLILFCLLSCKKEVEIERPEFIGYWRTIDTNNDFWFDINIDNNSNALYTEHSRIGGGAINTIHGIARANRNRLKIGRIYSFKIKEYPQKIDTTSSNIYVYVDNTCTSMKKATWKMVLNGPKFHMGSGIYYRAGN